MSILTHAMQQDAKIVTTSIDVHGDQVLSSKTNIKCRFRYITDVDKGANQEGVNTSDAIMWFEPETVLEEGTIIEIENRYWRIDKLIRARKMENSTIYFLKAFVKKHELVQVEDQS